MKKLASILFALLFLCHGAIMAYSTAGACKAFSGNVYTTWLELDGSSNLHVWAASGLITDTPDLWTIQEISVGGNTSTVTVPYLYSNVVGDMVAVWQYYDVTDGIMKVAAARLAYPGTTWVSDIISDSMTETGGFYDESASIDADGNIIVTWTSFDPSTSTAVDRGVTGSIGGSWGSTFVLPPPPSPS